MAKGFAFTSFDGADEDGVRAEVHVQKGTGTIKAIAPHDNGTVANIQISTEGLKFPQKAWINMDTPQFKMIEEAFDEGKTIEYRIESQRKLKSDSSKQEIPRTTPIAELRSTTEIARENTKTLLVGVNGQLTDEAVTHPKEDPNSAGRRVAPDPDIAKGAQAQQIQQQQHNGGNNSNGGGNNNHGGNPNTVEEPPYKEFNSDGTVNLGSYAVQAAFGAELFVRKSLATANVEATEDEIVRYASIALAIADRIQAYVTKKPRANRMVTSHTRVRSVVYDVIENFLPIPAGQNGAGDAEWVGKVGKLTLERFNASMRIANTPIDLDEITGKKKPAQTQAPEQKATPAPAQKEEPQNTPIDESTVKSAQPKKSASTSNPLDNATKSFEIYPQVKGIAATDETQITPETLELFKEFVTESIESEAEFPKVAKLISYTFGKEFTKASQLTEEQFGDFIDFYTEAGSENFQAVLDYVDAQ